MTAAWTNHANAGEIQATAAIIVAKDPSGQRVAAMADALLQTEVSKRNSLRLVEPARVLSGDPRTREEETQERARAAFADGRKRYDALNLDEAIARLGQAVTLFQQTGPLLSDLEELTAALTYLGAALILRGSADEGTSTFLELLTISPNYTLVGFPAAVTRVFEEAGRRFEQLPSGTIEIYSTPSHGAVYLDGRFRGVTPLVLEDTVSGTHYLRIEKIGYTVHGAPVEISPNQRVTSQTRLRSIKRGVELRDLAARSTEEVVAEGMGGSLRSLARLLGADTLIFAAVSQSGNDVTLTGAVFDVASATRLSTERSVLSVKSPVFDQELARTVSKWVDGADHGATSNEPITNTGATGGFGLTPGAGVSGASPQPTSSNAQPPSSIDQGEMLGVGLITIGGLAAVTGVVFGILAQNAYSDFRETSQASPDLRHLQDVGERNALIADVCFIGGAALAIGGVAQLFFNSSSEPTTFEALADVRAAVRPIASGAAIQFSGEF